MFMPRDPLVMQQLRAYCCGGVSLSGSMSCSRRSFTSGCSVHSQAVVETTRVERMLLRLLQMGQCHDCRTFSPVFLHEKSMTLLSQGGEALSCFLAGRAVHRVCESDVARVPAHAYRRASLTANEEESTDQEGRVYLIENFSRIAARFFTKRALTQSVRLLRLFGLVFRIHHV